MKKVYLALASFAAVNLTACGSGGGGSSSVAQHSTTEESSSTRDGRSISIIEPGRTAKTLTPLNSAAVDFTTADVYARNAHQAGVVFKQAKDGGRVDAYANWSENAVDAFNLITVEGQNIEVYPAAASAKSLKISTNGGKLTVKKADYSLRAMLDKMSEGNVYLVSKGIHPTQDMPTTGEFTYKGGAFHVDQGKSAVEADVALNVDFAQKSLNGTVSSQKNEFAPVSLQANITGNAFEGHANQIKVIGGFYGPQAQEISGAYMKDSHHYGVFNAQKQSEALQ